MPTPGALKWPAIAWCLVLAAASACALLAGCAEGPLARYGELNPWVKSQWDQEDAQYGPSFHTRVARLRSLRARAKRFNAGEQERLSQELAPLVQNEPNLAIRREVVLVLGRLPTEAATAALRLALTDSDPEMRVAACDAWRQRGGKEALERLSGVVNSDTDTDVRLAATRALAGFHDPAAVRALGVALDDSNPALQYQAVQSLRSVSGHDLGTDIAVWREYARGEEPPLAPAQTPSVAERFWKWQ